MPTPSAVQPIQAHERYQILDVVRGFALIGVCLANFPEFSLYTFLSSSEQAAMASASADHLTRWLQLLLIDGKFYTLFSLLFGIGFSIIIGNAMRRGANGMRIFYRRMALLALIGLAHLLLVWSGDILMLYALMGMILPLWRNASNRTLLCSAAFFLLFPVALDAAYWAWGANPADVLEKRWWLEANARGITEVNFASWLRDAHDYSQTNAFLMQGAVERMWEFVDGHRYFKVLGLFLFGFYIGRNRLYTQLDELKEGMKRYLKWSFIPILIFTVLYAYNGINHTFPRPIHSLLYALSVYPLTLIYLSLLCLAWLKTRTLTLWRILAAPGRMALTCYLCQSFAGIAIFYGIGMGLGTTIGLLATELIALGVFALEIIVALLWLSWFRYGPFEWVWRMLTYGQWLNLKAQK